MGYTLGSLRTHKEEKVTETTYTPSDAPEPAAEPEPAKPMEGDTPLPVPEEDDTEDED